MATDIPYLKAKPAVYAITRSRAKKCAASLRDEFLNQNYWKDWQKCARKTANTDETTVRKRTVCVFTSCYRYGSGAPALEAMRVPALHPSGYLAL